MSFGKPKFVLYRRKNKKNWRWMLYAENDFPIAASVKDFSSRSRTRQNIRSAARLFSSGEYEIVEEGEIANAK